MTHYMVVERFRPGCTNAIYDRLAAKGRLLPDGLRFVQSWPNKTKGICFQLMQTGDPALFDIWFACWSDLVEFEVFEVEPGKGP